MKPQIKIDRTVVAVRVEDTVHLMVELAAPEAPPAQRPPIDAVVVIDRSGSMAGHALESVVTATIDLLRLAGPDDRIAVVTFDSEVEMVLPLQHHDPDRAAHALRSVRPGGSTNLSGGWLKAVEVLNEGLRPGALTRIVMLTDGCANTGITDADRLCGLVGSALRQQISTTCVGFGDSYDETLLAGMADAGGGNDYWCAGPDQAAAVFVNEFVGLATVVAQNVSVEIVPTNDVVACLILNEFPITSLNPGFQVALGDAYGGERRRVIAMIGLAAQNQTGPMHVADVTVRWASIGDDLGLHSVTFPVNVDVDTHPDRTAPDPDVVEQVMLLRAAKSRSDAHRAAESGDFDVAARLLQSAADILETTSGHEMQVAELRTDVHQLESRIWDAASSKRLFSSSRETTKGRRSRFDGTES
jgi:Ca-activated chloride channel homolog